MTRQARKLGVLAVVWLCLAASLTGAATLETAQRQFDQGDYRAAVATLEAARQQNPRDARLHYWLARCHYELRDYDAAVTHAERAVELDSSQADYHMWLGRAYGRQAARERSFSLARKTKAAFVKAVQTDLRHIQARRDLMQYLAEAPWIVGGSDGDARKQCQLIATLDPVEGHLCWAAYWEEDSKPARAEAEYRRMLARRPARVEPYLEAADFFEARRDVTALEEFLAAAARIAPQNPVLDYFRGAARVMAGNRLEEAERMLQNYLQKVPPRSDRPSHAVAREWLGRLYERLGRNQQAAEQYRAALELDPRRKSAREALNRLQERM